MKAFSLRMIETVAQGLGHLKNEVVFVGGATVPLYMDDVAAPVPRPTEDVDCVIKIASRLKYAALEKELRRLGFKNKQGQDVPICRWEFQGVTVDVMPTDEKILGFSNQWYERGMASAMTVKLSPTTTISIFSLGLFVASKLDAYKDRGNNSPRFSPDFEDVALVLDGNTKALNLLKAAPPDVRQFILEVFQSLSQGELKEALAAHLGSGAGESGRIQRILDILQNIR